MYVYIDFYLKLFKLKQTEFMLVYIKLKITETGN